VGAKFIRYEFSPRLPVHGVSVVCRSSITLSAPTIRPGRCSYLHERPVRYGQGDGMNKIRWAVTAAFVAVSAMSENQAFAQDSPSQIDEDVKLFRKDLRSQKKQIIAANMDLSETEAQQFWPIYDRYAAELSTVSDPKYSLLKAYAQNYNSLTSEQAESYIKGRASVDESIMQLRLRYLPIFRKALSGKMTALFFQLDWRLSLILDLQLASQTPLIQP
jgi:hypothetical protein